MDRLSSRDCVRQAIRHPIHSPTPSRLQRQSASENFGWRRLFGTSREGLTDLLDSTPGGEIFVYRNNGPSTFHPKIYLFKSATKAEVLVGSGNLTAGGLFTNYEASLAASLDLAIPEDVAFLQLVQTTLDSWSQRQQGVCYQVSPELVEQLIASGLVRTEAQLAAMQQAVPPVQPPGASQTTAAAGGETLTTAPPPLFITVTVPSPPSVAAAEAATEAAAEATEPGSASLVVPVSMVLPPGIVPSQNGGPSCFVMTLQNTDVGFGQTTQGTSRRSPEVFIPLAALDEIRTSGHSRTSSPPT